MAERNTYSRKPEWEIVTETHLKVRYVRNCPHLNSYSHPSDLSRFSLWSCDFHPCASCSFPPFVWFPALPLCPPVSCWLISPCAPPFSFRLFCSPEPVPVSSCVSPWYVSGVCSCCLHHRWFVLYAGLQHFTTRHQINTRAVSKIAIFPSHIFNRWRFDVAVLIYVIWSRFPSPAVV